MSNQVPPEDHSFDDLAATIGIQLEAPFGHVAAHGAGVTVGQLVSIDSTLHVIPRHGATERQLRHLMTAAHAAWLDGPAGAGWELSLVGDQFRHTRSVHVTYAPSPSPHPTREGRNQPTL